MDSKIVSRLKNIPWSLDNTSPSLSGYRPKVLLVGTVDVDLRLDLMHQLKDSFEIAAMGSNPDLEERFQEAGFDYHNYILNRRVHPIVDLVTLAQLVWMFQQLQPQIVHAFSAKPCALARQAARLAGVPVVIGTLTGLSSLYASEKLSIRLIRAVYEPMQKYACHTADLTIFQNHDDWRKYVEIGIVPESKSTVIPGSGVPTDLFDASKVTQAEKRRRREELGIQPDELVVTLVSRVIRTKGVLEFMAAAKKLRPQYPNVRFLLVGPNDTGNVYHLNSDELDQLKQTVIWPGPRRDIPAVLAISDIFVFPSTHMEGVPRVLLEAASMGLPIITTDSPGCNEVVKEGVNGFFVPAKDVETLCDYIIRLVQHPQLRQAFGEASRRRALECFDLSTIAEQTRQIYHQLIASKNLLPESTSLPS
jgi:glycosyltransferase involved in cell wall biosynthesis